MDSNLVVIVLNAIIIALLLVGLAIFLCVRGPRRKRGKQFRRRHKGFEVADYEAFIHQLSFALQWMSNKKVGALIVIEKENSLNSYIALGYRINSRLNAEFLIAIFSNKYSSLHDGGIIVRGIDIVSVSSYFPITQTKLLTNVGARHRAAAGITENTDAISIIVSETTGHIFYGIKGELFQIYSEDISAISEKMFSILSFYID